MQVDPRGLGFGQAHDHLQNAEPGNERPGLRMDLPYKRYFAGLKIIDPKSSRSWRQKAHSCP